MFDKNIVIRKVDKQIYNVSLFFYLNTKNGKEPKETNTKIELISFCGSNLPSFRTRMDRILWVNNLKLVFTIGCKLLDKFGGLVQNAILPLAYFKITPRNNQSDMFVS